MSTRREKIVLFLLIVIIIWLAVLTWLIFNNIENIKLQEFYLKEVLQNL